MRSSLDSVGTSSPAKKKTNPYSRSLSASECALILPRAESRLNLFLESPKTPRILTPGAHTSVAKKWHSRTFRANSQNTLTPYLIPEGVFPQSGWIKYGHLQLLRLVLRQTEPCCCRSSPPSSIGGLRPPRVLSLWSS